MPYTDTPIVSCNTHYYAESNKYITEIVIINGANVTVITLAGNIYKSKL